MKMAQLWGFHEVTWRSGRLWLHRFTVEWEFWGSHVPTSVGGLRDAAGWMYGVAIRRGPSLFLHRTF